jgi:hypothetical protein
MSALTIQWGDVVFENLAPFNDWVGTGGAGIFVLMIQPDKEKAPNDYKALYFGEAESLTDSEFFRNHPKFRCCVSEAGRAENLFFAAFAMPDTSPIQRKQVQMAFVNQFHPVCNW